VHRPKLEDLEYRCVPAILFGDTLGATTSDNLGPTLSDAQVRLIFWGVGWQSSGGQALKSQVEAAVDTLNAGPYFYSPLPGYDLSQYRPGTHARPTRVASLSTTYHTPGTTFTETDVVQMLGHEYPPSSQYFYYVIPDPNSTPVGNTSGHNYWINFQFDESYAYSRNLPLGTPGQLDDLTRLYAREMVEAITDPTGSALQLNPRSALNWNDIAGGVAEQYTYRVNGVLAQSYWSRGNHKFIVPTGQYQDFLVSSSHVLTVNGDQLANHNDAITLDVSGNGVKVTLNGEIAQFDPGQISSIVVNTFTGNDTVNVERTLAGVPVTIDLGDGNDLVNIERTAAGGTVTANLGDGNQTVNISPVAHDLGPIQGQVFLQAPLGNDAVNINDQSTSTDQAFTLGSTLVGRGSAQIHYSGSGIHAVNIHGGIGTDTYTINGNLASATTMLDTGNGVDTVNLESTGGGFFTVQAGTGGATVNVSPSAKNLDNVQGNLGIFGGGSVHLTLNDQNRPLNALYNLYPTSFSRPGSGAITINNAVSDVTLNGTGNGNTFNVRGTANTLASLTVNAGAGSDVVNVGSFTGTLDDLQGPLTVNGQGGFNLLTVNDQGSANHTYSLTSTTLNRSGAATITYGGLVALALTSGGGTNTVTVASTQFGTPVILNGAAGSLSLFASDAANTWNLTGHNAGILTSSLIAGPVTFSGVPSLHGGNGADTFLFADGAGGDGTIDGGGGTNALDYSAYGSSVVVDLQTGFATGVGGGVSGIGTVVGGSGAPGTPGLYNLLIGSAAGGNTLTGGSGRRNLLVARGGPGTLNAGDQEDLLIAGSTTYDTEAGLASWQQIASYWAGGDDYGTRVANLTTPGSGVPLLDASTVTGNGGGNTLNGTGALGLIYSDGMDAINNFNPSSQVVAITP
jgi:hypothetical protein